MKKPTTEKQLKSLETKARELRAAYRTIDAEYYRVENRIDTIYGSDWEKRPKYKAELKLLEARSRRLVRTLNILL